MSRPHGQLQIFLEVEARIVTTHVQSVIRQSQPLPELPVRPAPRPEPRRFRIDDEPVKVKDDCFHQVLDIHITFLSFIRPIRAIHVSPFFSSLLLIVFIVFIVVVFFFARCISSLSHPMFPATRL
jgi:hypothetical protein